MKLVDAAKLYDDLQWLVAKDEIATNVMKKGCLAIIELGKVSSLPPPSIVAGTGRKVSFTWQNGHHYFELEIRNYYEIGDWLFYRNPPTNEYLADNWFIGKDPIPDKIINKLGIFEYWD